MNYFGSGEGLSQHIREIMDDFTYSSPPVRRTSSHLSSSNPLSSNSRVSRIRRGYVNEAQRRRRSHGLSVDNTNNSSNSNNSNNEINAEGLPTPKKRKLNQNQSQMEMAQLELELAYCDGGKYRGTRTRPESVLYQDDSVYCTGASSCNMIFKHPGDKCFTLEKLIIQGPATGYTSPVQEGVIFVTMDKNDLIAGCKYPFRFEHTASDEENDEDEDEDEDYLDQDDSDDDIEPNQLDIELPHLAAHIRSNSPPNFLESVTSNSNTASQVQTPCQIEPSARFKIRQGDGGRQKATLTFEPALSGRYILARFASPKKRDNIDIQFIGAWGYVGRRFFPSVTPR